MCLHTFTHSLIACGSCLCYCCVAWALATGFLYSFWTAPMKRPKLRPLHDTPAAVSAPTKTEKRDKQRASAAHEQPADAVADSDSEHAHAAAEASNTQAQLRAAAKRKMNSSGGPSKPTGPNRPGPNEASTSTGAGADGPTVRPSVPAHNSTEPAEAAARVGSVGPAQQGGRQHYYDELWLIPPSRPLPCSRRRPSRASWTT